jgi:hypothetical protein
MTTTTMSSSLIVDAVAPQTKTQTQSQSVTSVKLEYKMFNKAMKRILAEVAITLPKLSANVTILKHLLKVAKHVNYKMPYKCFKELIEDPYMPYIRSGDIDFFMSDGFHVDGFDDLIRTVRCVIRDVSENDRIAITRIMASVAACRDELVAALK